MNIPKFRPESVVLVGGGFGSLTAALELVKKKSRPPIILIEPRSRFIFSPLMYELLSDEFQSWEVAPTYQSLLAGTGIIHVQQAVNKIDTIEKKVIISDGQAIPYSKLVIATGSKPYGFNINGISEHALMFNNLKDVYILKNLIKYIKTVNFISKPLFIVGAGPSGIELACKISDLLERKVQINLLEQGDKLLPQGTSFNQDQSEKALTERGIKLYLNTRLISLSKEFIQYEYYTNQDNQLYDVPYQALIWTAGTRPFLPDILPLPTFINNRLSIDSFLRVIGFDDVFALGDVAFNNEKPCPATAQVAIQQAQNLTENLLNCSTKPELVPFEFNDLGEMLSLGIGEATITGFGLTIAGPLASKIRRMIYLTKMPSLFLGVKSAGAWLIEKYNKIK